MDNDHVIVFKMATRRVCVCKEELGHAVFHRHQQDRNGSVCLAKRICYQLIDDNTRSVTSTEEDSTFDFGSASSGENEPEIYQYSDHDLSQGEDLEINLSSDTEENSDMEVSFTFYDVEALPIVPTELSDLFSVLLDDCWICFNM